MLDPYLVHGSSMPDPDLGKWRQSPSEYPCRSV